MVKHLPPPDGQYNLPRAVRTLCTMVGDAPGRSRDGPRGCDTLRNLPRAAEPDELLQLDKQVAHYVEASAVLGWHAAAGRSALQSQVKVHVSSGEVNSILPKLVGGFTHRFHVAAD